MEPFKIIIVGGGIAGLAAAIALRGEDREILILEQSALHREIGATISLQPNASKIVEGQWGLAAALHAQGSMVDAAFEVYDLAGRLQNRIPLSTREKYGAERMIYHRADLHEALKHRATGAEFPGRAASIRVSSRVRACDCARGAVQLESGEVLTAHLVIGADGIKSVMRRAVLESSKTGINEPLPTGLCAYRMMVPTADLVREPAFAAVIDPRLPKTTMVIGGDRRLIMGPARRGSIYGVVALVPDERMHEDSAETSWTTEGDRDKMLQTFADFPAWAQTPLRLAAGVGLWQLRDLDPLPTWCRDRVILIGDAAHAMLPTQGQGASQAIEDAEALGAFFAGFERDGRHLKGADEVSRVTREVFDCRFDRASTIQAYSRQVARPATDADTTRVAMNPAEFMDYNCSYEGAAAWSQRQREGKVVECH
ncbi:2-polyprenyl-6-methoxyphenol hydroxylase [Aspergillus homomorphus CBS 101889]|uniref:2-polyprenyl-6-methoxyphenol hydroxylase n=1 Tax=Aspergillus homomorphus (strain CBS 101889) TaxID=1450537 RepID=A0A395I3X1_ASPHC|nr:2-polyprenyl-6-methoxyphenol hydroxylase [Aspergillus homomorphus CBS 101889]RAL14419.1 2-polyprenyl-6-methoxyphenol hydroxylase [Aspergillus homomorphus CBS 101889]